MIRLHRHMLGSSARRPGLHLCKSTALLSCSDVHLQELEAVQLDFGVLVVCSGRKILRNIRQRHTVLRATSWVMGLSWSRQIQCRFSMINNRLQAGLTRTLQARHDMHVVIPVPACMQHQHGVHFVQAEKCKRRPGTCHKVARCDISLAHTVSWRREEC